MGFLNFLKKGKKEEVKDGGLEIPLPPTMADDMGDISDLPSLTDDKEQGIPLPPLEPMDTLDKKYFDDFKLPDEKAVETSSFKDIAKQYERMPQRQVFNDISKQYDQFVPQSPSPNTAGMMAQPVPSKGIDVVPSQSFDLKKFDDLPIFKDVPKLKDLSKFGELPKNQVPKNRFVRAEHFGVMIANIEEVKLASEINKSLANVKKIKVSADKEFDRLHKSLEDSQRSLFYVDQELFEER